MVVCRDFSEKDAVALTSQVMRTKQEGCRSKQSAFAAAGLRVQLQALHLATPPPGPSRRPGSNPFPAQFGQKADGKLTNLT